MRYVNSYKAFRAAVHHPPRREDDRIGHLNDELLRHKPAHVAHGQPEAVPEAPEEQRIEFSRSSLSQISDGATLV